MNYVQAKTELARGRDGTRVLHKNLRTVLWEHDGAIVMRLVDSNIITWYPDGRIVLDACGWRTVTTKKRMNDYALGITIYQEKRQWFVCSTGDWDHPVPFTDGMTLHPDGTITGAASKARHITLERTKP